MCRFILNESELMISLYGKRITGDDQKNGINPRVGSAVQLFHLFENSLDFAQIRLLICSFKKKIHLNQRHFSSDNRTKCSSFMCTNLHFYE